MSDKINALNRIKIILEEKILQVKLSDKREMGMLQIHVMSRYFIPDMHVCRRKTPSYKTARQNEQAIP